MIAIDQAEVLFAADDAEQSGKFLAMLWGLMGADAMSLGGLATPPLFVWTIRADSMHMLLHATADHGLVAPELFPLPRLPRARFAEIINGPLGVAAEVAISYAGMARLARRP